MQIIDGKEYIAEVRQLIIEYTDALGRDLAFQNLDEELSNPAKKYTAPEGELLVAADGGKVVGMVAYHRHSTERCEMKRLYVKPEYRGEKLGERLVEQLLCRARDAGYSEMVLDTLKPMKSAIRLYEKLGFEQCDAYYVNPMSDVLYYIKLLK